MKRWLMASLPDALRWTPIHREMIDAWHHAAEDAADDVATGGDEGARINLATLIVKIARLAPEPVWPAATVSPFVSPEGLARRVQRLLTPATSTAHARSLRPLAAALACMATIRLARIARRAGRNLSHRRNAGRIRPLARRP